MLAPDLSPSDAHPIPRPSLPLSRSLIVLTGLPGTGKSYLSESLAQLAGVRPICLDQVRENLFPLASVGPGGKYTPEASRSTYEAAHETARRQLEADCPAILDGTFLMRVGRDQVREIARRYGAELLFIKVTAPAEVVADRMQHRVAGQDHGSEAGWDIYQFMVDQVASGKLGMADIEADAPEGDEPAGLLIVDTHHRHIQLKTDSPLARCTARWLAGESYQLA